MYGRLKFPGSRSVDADCLQTNNRFSHVTSIYRGRSLCTCNFEAPRPNIHANRPIYSFYAGLGATGDFHDNLITFAYQRQVESDPTNIPYYLECLQEVAEERRSEALQTLAAIEASKDKISLKDVRNAYKEFGLDFPSVLLDDDTVIGTFQSRIADAPRQEAELRRALKIIGQHRSSEKIQQIASNGRCVLAALYRKVCVITTGCLSVNSRVKL